MKRGRKPLFDSMDDAIEAIYNERSDGIKTKRGRQADGYCRNKGLVKADIEKMVGDYRPRTDTSGGSKNTRDGRGRPALYASEEDVLKAYQTAESEKDRLKIEKYGYKRFGIEHGQFRKISPQINDIDEINRRWASSNSLVYSSEGALKQQIRKECNNEMYNGMITRAKLTGAIMNSMTNHRIKVEDAERMAENLLNFFGYSDRMLDNDLRPDDRDVFYMMEDTGILTTEREETTLYDGRQWRINYWLLRTSRIQELLKDKKDADKDEKDDEKKLYKNLPDAAWEK